MGARFYLRKGIKFWQWHSQMRSICDFEVKPIGAPLGEEVTKHDDFTEAGFQAFVRFDNTSDRQIAYCTLDSQREQRCSYDDPLKWNPDGDSLIHGIWMGFKEVDLNAGRYSENPKRVNVARESYHLYKKIFLAFNCDEAEGDTNELLTVFRWIKGARTQTVIYPFEDNRETTDEESDQWSWFGSREADKVFGVGEWGQSSG
jgi:hypothetical protein